MLETHHTADILSARESYLACLNTCFGNWGNLDRYRWAFEPRPGFPGTDLMFISKDGEQIAGSAVSYRNLTLPDGQAIQVGIMTGSWTLPAARGQGCFTRIIEESVVAAARRGAAWLLAFVTCDNPSYRRLADAGSALVPSAYIVSGPETPVVKPAPIAVEPISDQLIENLLAWQQAMGQGWVHFTYPSIDDWRTQFLERGDVQVMRDEFGNMALIQSQGDTDQLQLLITASDNGIEGFLARSQERGKKFFMYSNRPPIIEAARQAGLHVLDGFITVLPAAASQIPPELLDRWHVQNGDRM